MLIVYIALALLLLGAFFVVISLSVTKKTVSFRVPPVTPLREDFSAAEKPEPVTYSDSGDSSARFFQGAMYEDRESCVTLFGDAKLDFSGISRFKSVRRISSGIIGVNDNSLDLRDHGKLFRYNFHRIKQIVPASESALVYPDSTEFPIIFISSDREFSSVLMSNFTKFQAGN